MKIALALAFAALLVFAGCISNSGRVEDKLIEISGGAKDADAISYTNGRQINFSLFYSGSMNANMSDVNLTVEKCDVSAAEAIYKVALAGGKNSTYCHEIACEMKTIRFGSDYINMLAACDEDVGIPGKMYIATVGMNGTFEGSDAFGYLEFCHDSGFIELDENMTIAACRVAYRALFEKDS